MNKTSLTALQFFSNFYQKVEYVTDVFSELCLDKRFPEPLRNLFASAVSDVDNCFKVIEDAIDYVRNNDLPENGNKNAHQDNGKPRN